MRLSIPQIAEVEQPRKIKEENTSGLMNADLMNALNEKDAATRESCTFTGDCYSRANCQRGGMS
jgi:hypothetical protein